jgi:hypothetical protein
MPLKARANITDAPCDRCGGSLNGGWEERVYTDGGPEDWDVWYICRECLEKENADESAFQDEE